MSRARALWLPALLVLAILAATVGASRALHDIEAVHRRDVVAGRLDRAAAIVDAAFRAPLERLAQVAAGVEAGGADDAAGFTILTRQMLRTPEVGAIGLIDRVTETDRARWERRYGVEMKEAASTSDAPAQVRPVHYAVRAVASRTSVPPGTDLGSDATRISAMRRAASLGEATFTPPVTTFGTNDRKLVQLVAFQPVRGGALGSRYVSATFTFDALAASLDATLPPGTTATIDDGPNRLVRVGNGRGDTETRTLRLAGRDLRVRTQIDYGEGTPWDEIVIGVGLLVALGVGAFAAAARRREQHVKGQAGAELAERLAVEEDLDRERGFSATLIAALPDGFVASDNRGIIVVNDAMCELTGYARSELTGRLFPHGFWPEESLTEVQRLRDRVSETGAAQMELTLRTKDDRRIPVLVSGSRVDGRHGPVEIHLIRDHRERAEATRTLTESEAQLRSLANAAKDMVVRLSRAERIEWVSPSAEQILGFEPEELLGRRLSDLFEGEEFGRLRAEAGVFRMKRKDGEAIWAEITVTPTIDTEGALTGMRSSIRDVTEREDARAELQRAHRRYRRMADLLPDTVVFMADRDRRFVVAAGGGLAATSHTPEQIEGRTVDEVLSAPGQQHLLPHWEAAFAGRGGEITHTSRSGREYLSRFLPLQDEDGRPDGAMVVATDVTLLRDLQDRRAGGPTSLRS